MKKINTKVCKIALSAMVLGLVASSAQAAPVIYEPFAQAAGNLKGQAGGVGITNIWNDTDSTKIKVVIPGSLTQNEMITTAGQINIPNDSSIVAYITTSSALSDAGLLADGATLWFSIVFMKTNGNGSNEHAGFALGTDRIEPNYNGVRMTGGYGVGLYVKGTGVMPAFYDGLNKAGSAFTVSYSTPYFIVGKIEWGATAGDDEKVTLYMPSTTDLATLGTGKSKTYTGFDQTALDVLSCGQRNSGGTHVYDEIRFGATYDDVIGYDTRAYWDINGSASGAGGATPTGTWNASNLNWNDVADGTNTTTAWTAGLDAVFAAGTDATGTYTNTVDGTQDIGGLWFQEGNVTLSGGTALRMTKDTPVYVAAGLDATIATSLSEDTAWTMTKAGGGTLVLSGNNSGATGGLNIMAGVTRFSSPSAINGTARNVAVGPSGLVQFDSSFGAGNIPSALANRIMTASTGVISPDNYASTDFDFNTPALSSAYFGPVGTVNYTGTFTPSGTSYRLGGGGGTLTLPSALTSTYSLDLQSGTVQLNGFDATVSALSGPSGSVLENGHATTAITVTVDQSSDTTFGGAINDGDAASLALVKSGSGVLYLTGNSSFSGGIELSAGKIKLASNANEQSNLGDPDNVLTFTGNAELNNANGQVTLPQGMMINSGVVGKITGAYGERTQVNGVLAGSGTLYVQGNSAGYDAEFLNTGNTFTGPIQVHSGDYVTLGMRSLVDSANKIGLDSQGNNGGKFEYMSGAIVPLVLNNRQFELITSGSAGTNLGRQPSILNNAATANTLTINTDLLITGTGTKRFMLGGGNTGDNTFAGDIPDAIGDDVLYLYKQNGGTWILSGENTFSGETRVDDGKLVLAASTCLSDTASLLIDAGEKVQLNDGVKEKVGSLVIDGDTKSIGTWGSTSSAAANTDTVFLGTGVLYVGIDPPGAGTLILLK